MEYSNYVPQRFFVRQPSPRKRAGSEINDRLAPLKLVGNLIPNFASLSLGSFSFMDSASLNPPEESNALQEEMSFAGIRTEHELFEPGMVVFGKGLRW